MERNMIALLPRVLQEVRDFQCLMSVYQTVFADLWRLERKNEDNFYLQTAGEPGIRHWERILGFIPHAGHSLDDRRQRIAAQIRRTPPYCLNTLLYVLSILTGDGAAVTAELSGFTLTLYLRGAWRHLQDAVYHLARQMIPANIALEVVLVLSLNTHRDLSRRTHKQLGAYTHYQLRNEADFT